MVHALASNRTYAAKSRYTSCGMLTNLLRVSSTSRYCAGHQASRVATEYVAYTRIAASLSQIRAYQLLQKRSMAL